MQAAAAQGLQGFFAAQGLQGLQAETFSFFAAHGLHGLQAAAAQGLQGFFAAHGLQGLAGAQAACASGSRLPPDKATLVAPIPATTTTIGTNVVESNLPLNDFIRTVLSVSLTGRSGKTRP